MTDGFRTRDNWSHNPESSGDRAPNAADSRAPESGAPRESAAPETALPRPAAATAADLEGAIGKLTRLIAETDDPETAAELVAERRAMRQELAALRDAAAIASGKVTPISKARA